MDIATTEALKMAREVDPNGILTKPDLVDKRMEDVVVSIINNEIVYFNKGYMIVRCRGAQGLSLRTKRSRITRTSSKITHIFKHRSGFTDTRFDFV
ncbi:interferon-induced GTP-binding protein Mx-like isoform X2 [Silurus meridionalis]|uniref:interferon-induced GTP-binding protein Mx-like isoform X2 n=1 Tax=Silurus meridionalis TaxID=175797 RepID=UPI001EEB6FDF|nr:interferon-induced GTP-binding protein Mx-like isoform X2 [Silurus meridionalis]